MSTLYGILGVGHFASDDDIRKAYKRKALETHPDRLGPNASEMRRGIAQAQFQKVNEAFNILGDSQKRRAYDASLLKPTATPSRYVEPKGNEEQLKRMKDRMKWAQQQRKRDEERIAAMRAKEKALKDAQERKEKEADMAKEFLQELFSLNPEWEERRRHVYQQRAQRKK